MTEALRLNDSFMVRGLDALPVWDGMIASGGNLYLAMMNGEIVCYSGEGD